MISTNERENIKSCGLPANIHFQQCHFKPLQDENDKQGQKYLTITCMKTRLSTVRRHQCTEIFHYVLSCKIKLFI